MCFSGRGRKKIEKLFSFFFTPNPSRGDFCQPPELTKELSIFFTFTKKTMPTNGCPWKIKRFIENTDQNVVAKNLYWFQNRFGSMFFEAESFLNMGQGYDNLKFRRKFWRKFWRF
jgi:hypothetical protein